MGFGEVLLVASLVVVAVTACVMARFADKRFYEEKHGKIVSVAGIIGTLAASLAVVTGAALTI